MLIFLAKLLHFVPDIRKSSFKLTSLQELPLLIVQDFGCIIPGFHQQRTGYPIRADFSDITQDNLQEMVQAVFLIAFVHASVIQKTAYPLCQCLFKEECICLPHFFCEGLHILFAEDNCADAALFGAVFLIFRYGLSALDEYFFPGMVVQQFSD